MDIVELYGIKWNHRNIIKIWCKYRYNGNNIGFNGKMETYINTCKYIEISINICKYL